MFSLFHDAIKNWPIGTTPYTVCCIDYSLKYSVCVTTCYGLIPNSIYSFQPVKYKHHLLKEVEDGENCRNCEQENTAQNQDLKHWTPCLGAEPKPARRVCRCGIWLTGPGWLSVVRRSYGHLDRLGRVTPMEDCRLHIGFPQLHGDGTVGSCQSVTRSNCCGVTVCAEG